MECCFHDNKSLSRPLLSKYGLFHFGLLQVFCFVLNCPVALKIIQKQLYLFKIQKLLENKYLRENKEIFWRKRGTWKLIYLSFSVFLAYLSLVCTYWKSNFSAFHSIWCITLEEWQIRRLKKGQVQFNIKTSKQAFHYSAKVCTGSNISCVDQSDVFGWATQPLFMRSLRL